MAQSKQAFQETTFYFYTGTGNSYRVAAWLAEAAQDAGAKVTLRSIGSACPTEEIGQGETALLGLVMPTHGFTAPWAMLRFALRLPRRKDAHGVVVATRAGGKIGSLYTPGIEGSGTCLIALILALKGYHVQGMTGVDMPSNWIAVHPGFSAGTVASIKARSKRKLARFSAAILSGGRRFSGWLSFLFGLCVLPISLAYLLVGRLFLAKMFFASDRCTGCGLCAEHCPNHAIEMRGRESRRRPYWTFRCENCMRCMGYCPTRAIEANYLLGVGVYLLAAAIPTSALLAWLAAHAPALAFLSGTPRWVLESVYCIVALGLLYPILHFLLGAGWINRFFTLITPTHYYRRYHEPETPFGVERRQ